MNETYITTELPAQYARRLYEEEKSSATIEKYILWNEAEDRCLVEIWIPIQKKDAP